MKSKTIQQIILTADEGMYLTNGQTYGKTVILPESANKEDWYEITEKEYEQIQKELATYDFSTVQILPISELPEDAVINGNTDNEQEVM
jgi:CMP-N-acetylneuraminic acid synthetase